MMDFGELSMASIASGLLLGAVGFMMFVAGKRRSEMGTLFGGITLGLLPMFLHSMAILWGASGLVLLGVVLLKRHSGSEPIA